MGVLALTTADLRAFDGEPRVEDLRLAEVLGFVRPNAVRRIVRRNFPELSSYGEVLHRHGAKPQKASKGGRPVEGYHLNEAQSVLVCMFSRTPQAQEARRQIIEVFLAWRHGKLSATMPVQAPEKPDHAGPWRAMEERIKQLEKLLGIQGKVDSPEYARAIAYAPTILYLDKPDGKRKRQRRPDWWYDLEVRAVCIETHRQMTIDMALLVLRHRCPNKISLPSRTSLGDFWLKLDAVRAAA